MICDACGNLLSDCLCDWDDELEDEDYDYCDDDEYVWGYDGDAL
jgi:hypothetical protein